MDTFKVSLMDTFKEIDSKKFSLASLFDSFESSTFRSLRGQDVDMLGGYCNDQTSSTAAMKRKYMCVERAPPPLILVDEISTTQKNLEHENKVYDKTSRRRSYAAPSLDTPPFIETANNGHPNCHRQSLMNSPEGQSYNLPEVALNVSALTEIHALEYKKRYDLALSILLSLVEKRPPEVAVLYKPFICDMLKRFRSEGSKVYRQNPFTVHLLENMYESYMSDKFTKTQSVKADVEQQPLDMRKIKGSKDDRYCEREFKREINSIDSFDWSLNDLTEGHQKQKCYAQQDIKGIDLTKSQNVLKTNELWTNIVQPCTEIPQPVFRENKVADGDTFKKSILSEQDMSRDIIHNRRFQDRTIHKQPDTLRKQRLDYSTHRVNPLVSPQNALIDDLRSTPLEQDVQKRILTVNTNSLIDENRFDEAVLILLRRVRQLLHSPETAELLIRHYLRKFERVSPDIQARNMLTNRINEAINIMAEEATARGSTMHEISVIKMGFTVAQFLSLIDAIDSNRVVPLSGPLHSTLPDKIQRLRDDISFISQNQKNKCATSTSQRITTNDIYQKQSRHTDLGVIDNKQEHHSTPVSDGHKDFGQVVFDFSQGAVSRHNTNNNVHCRDVGVNKTVGRQNSDPTYLPSDRHSYVSPYVTSTGSNDTSDVNVYKHQGFLGNRQNSWSNSIPTPYCSVGTQILPSTDAMHTNTLTSADMVMTNSNQTVMSTRLNDPPPYSIHVQPWSLHTRDQAFYHDETPQTVNHSHPPSNILSQGQTQGYGLQPMVNLNFQQGTMMFNPYVCRRRRRGKPRGKKQTETENLTKSDSTSCECDRPTKSTAEETSTCVDKTDSSIVDSYIKDTIANVKNALLQRNETKITKTLSEKLSSAGKDTTTPQPVVPKVFEVIDVDDDDSPVERLDHLPKTAKVGEKVRATEEIDQLLKQHYSDQSNTNGHIFKIPFKIDVSGVQLKDNREEVNFATMSSIVNWTIESEVSLSETPIERDITQSEPRKGDVMSPTVNEPEPSYKPVEASKYWNTPNDGLDTSLSSNSVCCSNTAGSSTSSRGSPDSLMMDVIIDSISAAVMNEDTEFKSHDGFTSASFPSNRVSTILTESITCKNLISAACSKLHELSSDSTCKSSEKMETVSCTFKDIAEKESKSTEIQNDIVPCKKGNLENFDSWSSSNFVNPLQCKADLVISQDSGSFNFENDSLINVNIPITSDTFIGHPNLQSEQTSITGMIVPVTATNTYENILPSETCSGSSDVLQSASKTLIYNLNCRESTGKGITDHSTHSHCLKQGIDIVTGRCTADSTAESKVHQIDRLSPDLTVIDRTNRKVTETLHLATGQHVAVMEKQMNPPAGTLKCCSKENIQSKSELPVDYIYEAEDGNAPAFEYDNSISFEENSPRLAENGRHIVYNENCIFAEGNKNSNDDHVVTCPSEALVKCNDTKEDTKCTMSKNMINKNRNANHVHNELLECTNSSLIGTYGNLNEYERRLCCNLNSKNIEISTTAHVSSVVTSTPMSSGKFGIQTITHPYGLTGSLMSRISVDPVSNIEKSLRMNKSKILEFHENDEVLNVGSSMDSGDVDTSETTLLYVASEVLSVTSSEKEESNELFDYHEDDNDDDDDDKCVLDRTETGIFIKDVFSIDQEAVVVQFDEMIDVATEEVDYETSRDSGEANETNFSPSVEKYDFDTLKQDQGKARSDTSPFVRNNCTRHSNGEVLEENTLKDDRNDTSVYVENFTEDGEDIPFIESQSSFISADAETEATKDHQALGASCLKTRCLNPANTPPSIETTLVDMDSYCGYVDSFRAPSVQGEKLNSPLIVLFTDVIYDYPRIVMTWFVCLICHYATCNAASVDRHFSEVHCVKDTENLTIESRDCFVSLQRLNENETIKVYNRKRKKTMSHIPKLGTKRAFCQTVGAITNPTPVAAKRSVFSCDKCAQVFTYSFALKKHRRSTCKFSLERLKLMKERQSTKNENLMVDQTTVKIDRGRESLSVNSFSDIERTFEHQYKSPVSTSVEVSHSTHGKINQAEKYCWEKDKNIEVHNDRPPQGGGPIDQSSLGHVMDGNTSMDDDNCAKCRKRYQPSDLKMDPWIQCDKCSLWFHGSCQKLGFDDVIALGHSDVDFICKNCTRKRNCRRNHLRDKSITPLLTTLSRELLQL